MVAAEAEPGRLAATHLSALDDALIDAPGRGGRWLLISQDGRRYPLTLDTLLRGSGVEKDGALDEHRAALRAVSALPATADVPADADPDVLSGAIEWLLYDWLMAHRESERSAAIEIPSGRRPTPP